MFQTTNQEMAVSPTSTAALNEDFTQNLRPKRKAYPGVAPAKPLPPFCKGVGHHEWKHQGRFCMYLEK